MLDIQKIMSSLGGNNFISSVLYLDEIESTNTYAKQKNILNDSLILTDHQFDGKGRYNRKWISEKDKNLTFSIKKKLPLSPAQNHYAVYYFSYRLFSVIKKYLSQFLNERDINKLEIKWPNDILYDRKKLCGILIESLLPDGVYIIGAGVNCDQVSFNSELIATSISLITGRDTDKTELLIRIVKDFSDNFYEIESNWFNKIYQNWKNSTKMINKSCDFIMSDNSVNCGKIIDLNEDGSILIENNDKLSKFHSGEIQITGFS